VFHKPATLLVCIALSAPGVALAEAGNPLTDRFSVGIGTFLLQTSTRVEVDGTSTKGTVVDTERDLGLNDADRFRIDAYWRFGERHKIRLMYFDTKQSAERTLVRELDVGDTVFPIDAKLDTTMETNVAEVAYEYAFLRRDNYELTGTFGVHNLRFKLAMTASQTGSGQTLSLDRDTSADGPLPVIGLRGLWRLSDRFFLDGQAQFFQITFDPYKGSVQDYNLSVVWMPLKHVGLGVGYNEFVTRLDVSASRFDGNLRWRYGGARIFATASF
jgi:hypothetical protein